jgi:hypothetical protein
MDASQQKAFEAVCVEVMHTTQNVPRSHGALHLFKVAEIAGYLAVREGNTDPFHAMLAGVLHDLRFWDEAERKIRKITISSEHQSKKSPREVLRSVLTLSESDENAIVAAIEHHNASASPDNPPLFRVLRDADRCSRQGYDGLLSILAANQFYGVPFYTEGHEILWQLERPLLKNEDIKSAVDDVHACNWWPIMETGSGKDLFAVMCKVNFRFLHLLAKGVKEGAFTDIHDPYAYWMGRLTEIFFSQPERVRLNESALLPDRYLELVTKLENPLLLSE